MQFVGSRLLGNLDLALITSKLFEQHDTAAAADDTIVLLTNVSHKGR